MNAILNDGRIKKTVTSATGYSSYFYKIIHRWETGCTPSEITRFRCSDGGDRLQDIIPVSSRDGNMLFKNKHCAKCHGVLDVVYWKLYILPDCLHILDITFANDREREEVILKTCNLLAFPPNISYSESVSCYGPAFGTAISTCNVTGQWDVYDHVLESRCSSMSLYYNSAYLYYSNTFIKPIYKNVYCYLCNTKQGDKLYREQCPLEGLHVVRNDLVVRFSLLITLIDTSDEAVPRTKSECLQGEVLDPYFVSTYHFITPINVHFVSF